MKASFSIFLLLFLLFGADFISCKKEKITSSSSAKLQFSKDSLLFDTVFTGIGSVTQHFLVRNKNSQRIKISSIQLKGGTSSQFIINVDGSKGVSFSNFEIAANDSMYVFVQVNVNTGSSNSPFIISDAITFVTNGNTQTVKLEAWGQNAYYHYATNAFKFSNGSYFTYSYADSLKGSFTTNGPLDVTWKNDKPHVIYGYCVVDSGHKLTIPAGTHVYLNYKAGLWVFKDGQMQVLGAKDNEVTFQSARLDKLIDPGQNQYYSDEAGQWDRIWINEGSDNNVIDYAIIKNGYIGVQAELLGDSIYKGRVTITNTKIQNMSKWGIYGSLYKILGANNVISNCGEYCVNLTLGGAYEFIHCTMANYWSGSAARTLPAVNLNNYNTDKPSLIYTFSAYFGNNIIDGSLYNELNLDFKSNAQVTPTFTFNNNYIKTTGSTAGAAYYNNIVKNGDVTLVYKNVAKYDFEPDPSEMRIRNFVNAIATQDASLFPKDLNGTTRNTTNVTVGAYEVP